jgi:hypothetical protein
MAATQDRDSRIKASARRRSDGIKAAAVVLYKGTMAVRNASDYATPATVALGRPALGIVTEKVDNSGGSAGDKKVELETGVHLMKNHATQTLVDPDHVKTLCYIYDDETVGKLSASAGGIAGIVEAITDDGVYVYFGGDALAVIPDATAEDIEATAVSLLTRLSRVTVDGTDALTLADGLYIGQIKHIIVVATDNTPVGTLTPTSLEGFSTITLDAVGESVTLVWNGSNWDPIAVAGATLNT